MRWAEIALQVPPSSVEPASAVLMEAGCGGVVIEDPAALSSDPFAEAASRGPVGSAVRIAGYLPVDDRLESAIDGIEAALARAREAGFGTGDGITLRTVDDASWAGAWKAHFKPMRIGRRLVVKPSWDTFDAAPDDLVLELDPEMAFGSGAHPTTQLCLQLLEEHFLGHGHVLDWGTGSGILAVAAAKLGAASVLAIDLDPQAVSTTDTNAARNDVEDIVSAAAASIEELPPEPAFDWILANILAQPLIVGAPEMRRRLRPGGSLLLSGIIDRCEAAVIDALHAAGFPHIQRFSDEEWRALLVRT